MLKRAACGNHERKAYGFLISHWWPSCAQAVMSLSHVIWQCVCALTVIVHFQQFDILLSKKCGSHANLPAPNLLLCSKHDTPLIYRFYHRLPACDCPLQLQVNLTPLPHSNRGHPLAAPRKTLRGWTLPVMGQTEMNDDRYYHTFMQAGRRSVDTICAGVRDGVTAVAQLMLMAVNQNPLQGHN